MSSVTHTNPQNSSAQPYQVMLVDDSSIVLGLLTKYLGNDPDIKIVATAMNGQAALREIDKHKVEIVVLDIEMPIMDGLTALPQLLAKNKNLKVIISSTLSKHNASVSIEAMEKGASDYITKPTTTQEVNTSANFKDELIGKIKAFGAQYRRQNNLPTPSKSITKPGSLSSSLQAVPDATNQINLRKLPTLVKPEVIAIGSSTGGPQALFAVLKKMKGITKQPIVITQHMPPTFTTILAEHIHRNTGLESIEVKDGDILTPGRVHLAPGDYHMGFVKTAKGLTVKLDKGPQVNYCRPAVDFMLDSLLTVFDAKKIVTVILTGMGNDGQKGCQKIADQGGVVVAQDRDSSVVWGMPGAVASNGIAHLVMPLDLIGDKIKSFATGFGA